MKISHAVAKILVFSLLASWNAVTAVWHDPFDAAIIKFDAGFLDDHPTQKKEFKKSAREYRSFLREQEPNWFLFVQPTVASVEVNAFRNTFRSFFYVSEVFPTKPGTLVFTFKGFPEYIIKIDNRSIGDTLNSSARSYLTAFKKAQRVQQEFRFPLLYFPYEYGKSLKAAAEIVISERIPLFSDAEIDHIVLLLRFILFAEERPSLHQKLQEMYLQLVEYICRVDFDDINFRNIPFTIDGRLAPFDTDSDHARTGVFAFLSQYFAVKLFPHDDALKKRIEATCKTPVLASLNPFSNEKEELARFNTNEAVLDEMITFFSAKAWPVLERQTFKTAFLGTMEEAYAEIVDAYISKKFYTDRNVKLFGQRCEHARVFVTQLGNEIKNGDRVLGLEQADLIVLNLLEQARVQNIIYASPKGEPILSIINRGDLTGYLCF